MSLVYITKHDESIYNLTQFDRAGAEQEVALQMLSPARAKSRYVSKYHKRVIQKTFDVINISPYNKIVATKSGKSYHKTMGYADQPIRNPCDFLRKNEGLKWKRTKEHICGKLLNPSPPIPKISELPKKIPKVVKNMIKINIEKARKAVIRRPKPKMAFTCNGDTRELCNSGIMPAYIFSPTFGKLPNYILKYNKILSDRKEYQQQFQNQNQLTNKNEYYLLGPEERLKVIEGLKKNWYEKQLLYQRLPVLVESSCTRHRRQFEQDLHQLEEDIVLLEYNPQIYICN